MDEQCRKSVYKCRSNYYLRIFLGIESGFGIHDINETHLEMAKNVSKRISCIVIVEKWNQTMSCLGNKLGVESP